MPKSKRPPETPETQFKRFVEAAKQKGIDEKEAEKAFKAIAKPHKRVAAKA